MKKVTLFAALAALALCANAQYVTDDAGIQPVLDSGNADVFYVFQLDDQTISDLQKAGKTVYDYRINDVTRCLYIWEGTFVGNETSAMPVGVDYQADGHVALTVSNVGWSGAGYCALADGPIDFSELTENAYAHLAYAAASNPPASVAFMFFNDENGGTQAKFAVGSAFVDGAATYPTIGPKPSDEWQAVDATFADLKKVWPAFVFSAAKNFTGNYVTILAGGVQGTNIDLDAIYFYQPGDGAGISNIEMGKNTIIVSGKTVNAAGAKTITLYDLTGKEIKRVNSSVLGLNGVGTGLYIVKADNTVAKVLVK